MEETFLIDFEEDEYFESEPSLPGIWLPPLMVLLVGLLIGMVVSGLAITEVAEAAPDQQEVLFQHNPTQTDPLTFLEIPYEVINSQSSSLSPVFTPEVRYWEKLILVWSVKNGLDPNLVATVMQIESCGDPDALSSTGAMGLFQVMPFHFYPTDDPYDPETNASRGLAYLRKSLELSTQDARLALAGYNAGLSAISKSEGEWPDETQRYTYWGSGIFQEASSGMQSSTRLAEWLGKGGASLCRQAAARLGLPQ